MSSVVKWSVILGVAVAASNAIFLALGLHRNPVAGMVAALEAVTAVSQATNGLIGTFVTSSLLGAIAGAFLRRK